MKILLTERFKEALVFAFELHKKQLRKGPAILPYFPHLMSVSALVVENGGDEKQAIAGLLHDAIEDQAISYGGADKLRKEIKKRFGERVLEIVNACTDAESIPKPPWRERKKAYIDSIAREPEYARLVSLADKVHNARAILSDYRVFGESVWERFAGKKEGSLWYYRSLADVFSRQGPEPLASELERIVSEIERLSGKV
jgi:(p)ppGpp synthase/HD superfamily hydrolase